MSGKRWCYGRWNVYRAEAQQLRLIAIIVYLCGSSLPAHAFWGTPLNVDSLFANWCDSTRGEYDRVVDLAQAMYTDSTLAPEQAALMGRPRPIAGSEAERRMRKQLANAWFARGMAAEFHGRGEYGLIFFREAQKVLEGLGDVFANAHARCYAADMYWRAGRYTEAVITMQPAAQQYLLHGDTTKAMDAVWTIAQALAGQGNLVAAAKEYQRALDLLGNKQVYRRFQFLVGLAEVELELRHVDQAFVQIAKAQAFIDDGSARDEYLQLGTAKARAYYLKGDCMDAMDLAKPLLDSARSRMELMSARPGLAATLCEVWICLGKAERALPFAMECLSVADSLTMKKERLIALRLLALVYKRLGRTNLALDYLERYQAEKDSTASADAMAEANKTVLLAEFQRQQIADSLRIVAERSREATENAIALSRSRTQRIILLAVSVLILIIAALLVNRYRLKRRLQVAQLRASLSRDLHDDIGSTLSSISILSIVARRKAEVAGDTDAAASLDKISDRSQRLMRNMSDIVWSVDPQKDSLQELIVRMREFGASVLDAKGIAYTFHGPAEVPALTLAAETKNNLYLILKEAINNVVKHAEAGRVEVWISIDAGALRLVVKDNGSGFDALSATHGLGGNGLRNMRARAHEMEADLSIKGIKGKGTVLSLILSL